MSYKPSLYEQRLRQTRQQLNLLREGLRPAAPATHPTRVLREDVQNVNNTALTELQQAMAAALESSLEITDAKEEGGVRTVEGVLHLKQDMRFSFTSQQPDGCYIACPNLELSERTAEIISKLQAYFTTWYSQSTDAGPAGPGALPAPTT
jgi:hypothetical protein